MLAAREALAAEPAADAGVKVDVGRSLIAVASCSRHREDRRGPGDLPPGRESLLAGLAGSRPSARGRRWRPAGRGWAGLLLHDGRYAEALAAYRQARADQEALAAPRGPSTEARRDLANTINGIGLLLWKTGRPAEAEAESAGAGDPSEVGRRQPLRDRIPFS